MSNTEKILRAVFRGIARMIVWISAPTTDVPEGCPNCNLTSVRDEKYDICPWCNWGPNTEPERPMNEAHSVFVDRAITAGMKESPLYRWLK